MAAAVFAILVALISTISSSLCYEVSSTYWFSKMAPSPHTADDLSALPSDSWSGCTLTRSKPTGWIYVYGTQCKTFPKYYYINSTKLEIKATSIEVISATDFNISSHLNSIAIEMNPNLTLIESGVFKNMSKLTNLSISDNYKLQSLERGVFEGLINLIELRMVKSNIVTIQHVALVLNPLHLPKLKVLDISENILNVIEQNDLSSMDRSSVEVVNLVLCSLNFIHSKAFNPLKHLTTLRLGMNSLATAVLTELVTNIVEMNPYFRELNLLDLALDRKPMALLKAIAHSNISTIVLEGNPLDNLVVGFFPVMPKLEELNLKNVLATDLQEGTIDASNMPNLKALIISQNKLPGVIPGMLLPQLEYLDASSNSGDEMRPSLFSIAPSAFRNMYNLKFLDLSYNRLMFINNETFLGLQHLEVLLLTNSSIYTFDDFSFHYLSSLKVLDLSSNVFPNYFPLTRHTFYGLAKLEFLNLNECGVSNLSSDPLVFSSMKNLKYLMLRSNKLITLSDDLFKHTNSLLALDVAENMIASWTTRLFEADTELQVLYLTGNEISYLSLEMVSDLSAIEQVDLHQNPIVCNCELFDVLSVETHLSNHSIYYNFSFLDVDCFSPAQWQETTLVQFVTIFNAGDQCPKEEMYQSNGFIVSSIVSLILVGFVVSTLYYYRWHLNHWLFLAKLEANKRKRKVKVQISYQYDAFVSYSNEDRNFVVRMVSMLENYDPFFKLCVYERDFQIGDVISDSVMESLAASKRTILVVSDSFAKSQWCMWEMQIAHHYKLFVDDKAGHCDPLVMIKLGEVIETHMTPTLKYLMKTRVYLPWDPEPAKQRTFWERLRNTLSPPLPKQEVKPP